MRDIVFKLLVVVLIVVLCINFIRYFMQGEQYHQVDALSILDALSQIGSDPTPIFDSFSSLTAKLLDVSANFANIYRPDTYTGGSTVLKAIKSFFISIWTFITSIGDTIQEILVILYNVLRFIYEFSLDIFNFLNVVIGTNFDIRSSSKLVAVM